MFTSTIKNRFLTNQSARNMSVFFNKKSYDGIVSNAQYCKLLSYVSTVSSIVRIAAFV